MVRSGPDLKMYMVILFQSHSFKALGMSLGIPMQLNRSMNSFAMLQEMAFQIGTTLVAKSMLSRMYS